MVMSWILAGMFAASMVFSWLGGTGPELAAAALSGAQQGVTLAVSMAGALCLWSGVGKVLEKVGATAAMGRLLRPVIGRLFPSARKDDRVAGAVAANMAANFMGLGNAATPMGIQAVQAMGTYAPPGQASDEMCRFIVMNTASIQLIPANVAAVRMSLGCERPFDILPGVWLTSVCSVTVGLCVAWLLGRRWK